MIDDKIIIIAPRDIGIYENGREKEEIKLYMQCVPLIYEILQPDGLKLKLFFFFFFLVCIEDSENSHVSKFKRLPCSTKHNFFSTAL